MKTLKQEEVDGRLYRDLAHAKASLENFIAVVYNNKQRLHSALAYAPREEFELNLKPGNGSLLRKPPGKLQPPVPIFLSQDRGAVHNCVSIFSSTSLALAGVLVLSPSVSIYWHAVSLRQFLVLSLAAQAHPVGGHLDRRSLSIS